MPMIWWFFATKNYFDIKKRMTEKCSEKLCLLNKLKQVDETHKIERG